MIKEIVKNLKENPPLVHGITNYVTVNDCANILLAAGAAPIMADDSREVEEIASICNSLYINIGTLNARTIEVMILAGKTSNSKEHPVVLDPVGAGASSLRTTTTFELLDQVKFSVIRGNISEIKTVAQGQGTTKGVDADENDAISGDNLEETIEFAKKLSEKTDAIIGITGAIDIVADHKKAYIIRNGHPLMSKITGTGCMLTALIAAYCGSNVRHTLDATATAICAMGVCGERAYEKLLKNNGGTSSYRMYIIDEMSQLTAERLESGAKIEIR